VHVPEGLCHVQTQQVVLTLRELELWVTSRTAGGYYDVIDAPFDECGPITQSVTAVVTR